MSQKMLYFQPMIPEKEQENSIFASEAPPATKSHQECPKFFFEAIELIKLAKEFAKFPEEGITTNISSCVHFEVFEMRSGSDPSPEQFIERFTLLCRVNKELLTLSSLFFFQTIFAHNLRVRNPSGMIKIFAACLWLAHKLLSERALNGKTFQKLVGIRISSLIKMEMILLREIFNFNITHSQELLSQFEKSLREMKRNISFKEFKFKEV